MSGSAHVVVVEADGGVYPCDFYVIDEWYLGNLTQSSFEDIRAVKQQTGSLRFQSI